MSFNFKTEIWRGVPEFSGSRAYPGVLVICVTDRLKYFTKGKVYRVESILENPEYMGAYKLKMKGINGFFLCANFNLMPIEFIRESKIDELIDIESSARLVTTPTTERKIDIIENKKYQLFELIINRICRDKNYLASCKYTDFYTLVDTICKGDKSFGVKPEDFHLIEEINIRDILDDFIKTRQKIIN